MGRKVGVIGACLDLGASRRGAEDGPHAVRSAGLLRMLEALGHEVEDFGNLELDPNRTYKIGDSRKKYREPILKMCADLHKKVHAMCGGGYLPVTIGGDHAVAMGSVSGVARHYRAKKQKIGLIWIDAHGDFHTPATSPTGNIHGMPVAHLLGYGDKKLSSIGRVSPAVDARNVALIGLRDLDEDEKPLMRDSGVHVFTMKDVDRYGMGNVFDRAMKAVTQDTAAVHVSCDVDALDPTVSPGTGTTMRGGLAYREAHLFMELIADSGLLAGVDMVEVNPLLDVRNQTATIAAELVASALGKRIF